jgi:hypothetical protein
MSPRSRFRVVCGCLLAGCCLTPTHLAAQDSSVRHPPPNATLPSFEVFVGAVGAWPQLDTYATVRSNLDSALMDPHEQTVKSCWSKGFDFGAAFFPRARVGIEGRFGRFAGPLSSPNSPITWHPYGSGSSVQMPVADTTGHWTWYVFSAGPALRGAAGRRATWSISGGLSYVHTSGEIANITIASFRGIPLYLKTSAQPTNNLGINVGGAVALQLVGELSLLVDGRYVWAPTAETTLTAPNTSVTFSPISVSPSHTRLLVGAQYTFWRGSANP